MIFMIITEITDKLIETYLQFTNKYKEIAFQTGNCKSYKRRRDSQSTKKINLQTVNKPAKSKTIFSTLRSQAINVCNKRNKRLRVFVTAIDSNGSF